MAEEEAEKRAMRAKLSEKYQNESTSHIASTGRKTKNRQDYLAKKALPIFAYFCLFSFILAYSCLFSSILIYPQIFTN
jgi:hypothetical protein